MQPIPARLPHLFASASFAVLVCLFVAGCGASLGDVEGTVKYKGKSIKSGNVMFVPSTGQPVYGSIKNDGTYSASKVPTGEIGVIVTSADPRGAPARPGSTMTGRESAPKVDPDVLKELMKDWFPLPDEYGEVTKPKITVTVKSGKNDLPIELK